MAGEHPIQGLMRTAMESIKEMVDVNTIVGEPVETQDGSVIVPVSRVSFGFAAGGAEYGGQSGQGGSADGGDSGDSGLAFGGGSGAGVTIQPVGFLVVGHDSVRMLPVDGRAIIDRLLDVAPNVLAEVRNLFAGRTGQPGATGGPATI
ncbi:MAG: GerW family sporulation protein [Chloroflexota bacterium]